MRNHKTASWKWHNWLLHNGYFLCFLCAWRTYTYYSKGGFCLKLKLFGDTCIAGGLFFCYYKDAAARLSYTAGSLKLCDDADLLALGYRTIHFRRYRFLCCIKLSITVHMLSAFITTCRITRIFCGSIPNLSHRFQIPYNRIYN